MTALRSLKRKKLATKPGKKTAVAIEKATVEAQKSLTQTEENTGSKFKKSLTQAQKALRAAQQEVKRERQARIQAEKALTKAQDDLIAAQRKAKQEHQASIKRISFVVRLTVDKHGQPLRTEIEQVESSRKQNFLGLDGEHLVAFMTAHISPIIVPEDVIPTTPSPQKVTALLPRPLRPKANLIVSNVQAFHTEKPDFMTLILTPEEPFVVQARFQLQGPDADSLTTQAPSYEMKVYANEVISGKSKLLTNYSARLIPNMLEYITTAEAPGLSSGLYRLFTVVILGVPIEMAGFYSKTIIHMK